MKTLASDTIHLTSNKSLREAVEGVEGEVQKTKQHFKYDDEGAHVIGESDNRELLLDTDGAHIKHDGKNLAEFTKDGVTLRDEIIDLIQIGSSDIIVNGHNYGKKSEIRSKSAEGKVSLSGYTVQDPGDVRISHTVMTAGSVDYAVGQVSQDVDRASNVLEALNKTGRLALYTINNEDAQYVGVTFNDMAMLILECKGKTPEEMFEKTELRVQGSLKAQNAYGKPKYNCWNPLQRPYIPENDGIMICTISPAKNAFSGLKIKDNTDNVEVASIMSVSSGAAVSGTFPVIAGHEYKQNGAWNISTIYAHYYPLLSD